MTNVTIAKAKKIKGSNRSQWNVSLNDVPFGAIWTYDNTANENSPYAAKPLNAAETQFFDTLKDAKTYMINAAA